MMAMRWFLLVSAVLVCGCAKSPPPAKAPVAAAPPPPREQVSPVHERGSDKLIVSVGRAGGTLELRNGGRVEFPRDALSEPIQVTFSEGGMTTAFSNHEYESAIGPTLELAPQMALGAPITISIPLARLPEGFDEEDLAMATEVLSDEQRALDMTGVQTRWDYMPARSDNGRVTGELSQVPGMRVQFVVSRGS